MAEPLKIPYTIDSLDAAPKPLRLFYAEGDDHKFHLQLDGTHPDTAKLGEFRANNRSLAKIKTDLETRLAAFEGIDPDAAKADRSKLTDLETSLAAEKAAADVLKAQHQAELASVTAETTTRAAALETALTAEKSAHAATAFRNLIGWEFLQAGGRPEALDFVIGKAAATFEIKDGTLATKEFSKDAPGQALSAAEWMRAQLATSTFAFKPSPGVGSLPTAGAPVKRTIPAGDVHAFGQNIEAIARGDVTVS